jgi:putative endonuclease
MGCKGSSVQVGSPRQKGADYTVPFFFRFNMYTTYIIYSLKIDKYYTGQSDDLDRRMEEHNRGKTPFLATGMPWHLVYSKEFNSRTEAIKLEKFIKKRGAARFLKDNNIISG